MSFFFLRNGYFRIPWKIFEVKKFLNVVAGGGQHTSFIAPYAKYITAVDLNTIDIAIQRNSKLHNIKFIEADIACMDLGKKFDIVFSIGVVHHTDNPYKTFENLRRHVMPGGKLILWVYSEEGNFMVKNIVEPLRKSLLWRMNKKMLLKLSKALTILMYIPIYSLYLLPIKFMPYYEYFENFRKLSFGRNHLNVFDKLNAPQVIFINRAEIGKWFNQDDFKDVHISNYKGVSWRASGVKNG